MMKILVLYASTDGQTRKIARHVAGDVADMGHMSEMLSAEDIDDLDVADFDRAIIAGSVHLGRFQAPLVAAVKDRLGALANMPTLFLAVSLSAASKDPDDLEGLGEVIARFTAETGWTPGRTENVAGAFRFSQYDYFRSLAMRWIAHQKGETAEPHKDREFTDWAALDAVVAEWIQGNGQPAVRAE